MKRFRSYVARMCVISLLLTSICFTGTVDAKVSDSLITNQVRINCGSVNGFMNEQYLSSQSNSFATTEDYDVPDGLFNDYGAGHMVTKRYCDTTGYFTYHIPVNSSLAAPLYLSMVTKGEVKVTADGTVVLNTGNSGEGTLTAREIELSTNTWSDGYVDVKFEDADTSDGWGPNIYWLELGPTSPWRERVKHVEWDSSNVIWQVGYYDGYGNEFKGTTTDFTVGGNIETLGNTGTIYLRWNQSVTSGKKYYLITGVRGGIGYGINNGTVNIDMKNDGSNEVSTEADLEKLHDLDVTNQVLATGNVVRIQMPANATLDFATLVEVTPGNTTDSDSMVVFKGNEMAQNWTKIANMTMFWNNEYMVDKGTGFIDASLPNGIFANGYWTADAGITVFELAKWGYLDYAKQAINYQHMDYYYNSDNGSTASILAAITYLMKTDNYTGTFVTTMWPRLKEALDYYCSMIDGNSFHLIQGNNYEGTSNGYGINNNSGAYYALRAGAEAATKLGYSSDSTNWSNHAVTLYNGIETNLKTSADRIWYNVPNNLSDGTTNRTLPAGTFRYSLTTSGADVDVCHAGWFSVGSQEELAYGSKGDSTPSWRQATNTMLDYFSTNYWPDWKAYGHNQGFGTDYGVLSERGGWPVLAMMMSDRLDMAKKNLDHIIWSSTDYNFPGGNESVQETSPWLLPRDVDSHDGGVEGAQVGNGGYVEDMNLIEYIITLKNVRLMAGLDDTLSGTNNLVIMPRIFKGWDGVKINQWPVAYKNGSAYGKSKVTYDYSISPEQGSMSVSAANAISGVQFRFGPFEKTATVSSATANGSAVSYTVEDRGDARWVWVTQDIGTTSKNIVVNMTVPNLIVNNNFNNGSLLGWTASGGTWTNPGTCAQVVTTGDAWNTYGTTTSDLSLTGDIKIINGQAAGLTFRNNGTGSTGYDLILDAVEGVLKLCKRPYTELASMPLEVKLNRTYSLKVEAVGSNIKCYLDGVKAIDFNDSSYASGKAGMFAYSSTSQIDNLLAFSTTNVDPTPTTGFIKGINLGGNAVTINGNGWLSYSNALNDGFTVTNGSTSTSNINWSPTPGNSDLKAMLDSQLYRSAASLNMTQTIANGTYSVYMYTCEDSQSNSRTYDLKLEGDTKASNIGSMAINTWQKYGPYSVTVTDGVMNIDLVRVTGDTQICGLEIFGLDTATPDFETNLSGWNAVSGTWTDVSGGKQGVGTGDVFMLATDTGTNFTYEGDIKVATNGPSAGALLFRSNNDCTQTYVANISTEGGGLVKLFKFPYEVIGTYDTTIVANTIYHLKVTTSGSSIKVYFNGNTTPVIDATDTTYASGRFGLNVYNGTAVFQNINK